MGIPALMPFQVPQQNQFNLGDTYVQMAKMKAYQQQARLDELKLGQESRKEAKDQRWEGFMRGVFTPDEQPSAGGLATSQSLPTMSQPQAPQGGLAGAQAGPPQGMPQGGMPSSLAAMAQPTDTSQPPLMNPSMQVAPVQGPQAPAPPQPSLAAAQAPAAPAPAPGLGQGTGTRPMFQGLLQPINERALIQAHNENPERTEKWFTGYMKMQGDKIEQTKKVNDQVYRTLRAVEKSPNQPEAWARGIQSLREQGIPIPKDLDNFSPALLQFKLNEHRTAETEVKEADAEHKRQQASAEQALAAQREQETKLKPAAHQAWIEGQRATTGKTVADTAQTRQQIAMAPASQASRLAKEAADTQNALADAAEKKVRTGLLPSKDEREALAAREALQTSQQTRQFQAATEAHNVKMRPLQEKELAIKNRRETILADTALTEEERKAELFKIEQAQKDLDLQRSKVGVPQYLKDDADTNTALNQVIKGKGKEGQPPDAQDLADARQLVIDGKIAVASAHGKDAAAGAVIKDVLTNAATKGQNAESVHSILDDIEELRNKGGVLSSKLKDRIRMGMQTLGTNDEEAARTWAIQNLGEELTLAKAGGKLGGQLSDPDRELIARATGGMGKLLTPAQQRLAIDQLRTAADRDVEFANRHIKQYNETKTLPEFGKVRQERKAREITQEQFDTTLRERQAKGWTAPMLRKWYEDQGKIVRAD